MNVGHMQLLKALMMGESGRASGPSGRFSEYCVRFNTLGTQKFTPQMPYTCSQRTAFVRKGVPVIDTVRRTVWDAKALHGRDWIGDDEFRYFPLLDYPPDSCYNSKQVEYDKSFQASGLFGPVRIRNQHHAELFNIHSVMKK